MFMRYMFFKWDMVTIRSFLQHMWGFGTTPFIGGKNNNFVP